MALVQNTAIAKALNITVRRVNQLVHEGLPREERGLYDLGACMLWYIRYLQAALAKKATLDEDGNVSSLQGNRQELIRVQIERERIALAKEKGLSMPIEAHERIVSDLIQETKARVRAVGSRIAPELVGETSRLMIQAKLERAHDEALLQLSKVVPRIPVVVEGSDGDGDLRSVPASEVVEEEVAPAKSKDKPKKKPAPVKQKAKAKAAKSRR